MTLKTWPEPKWRVRCLNDWATQVPLACTFFIFSSFAMSLGPSMPRCSVTKSYSNSTSHSIQIIGEHKWLRNSRKHFARGSLQSLIGRVHYIPSSWFYSVEKLWSGPDRQKVPHAESKGKKLSCLVSTRRGKSWLFNRMQEAVFWNNTTHDCGLAPGL